MNRNYQNLFLVLGSALITHIREMGQKCWEKEWWLTRVVLILYLLNTFMKRFEFSKHLILVKLKDGGFLKNNNNYYFGGFLVRVGCWSLSDQSFDQKFEGEIFFFLFFEILSTSHRCIFQVWVRERTTFGWKKLSRSKNLFFFWKNWILIGSKLSCFGQWRQQFTLEVFLNNASI